MNESHLPHDKPSNDTDRTESFWHDEAKRSEPEFSPRLHQELMAEIDESFVSLPENHPRLPQRQPSSLVERSTIAGVCVVLLLSVLLFRFTQHPIETPAHFGDPTSAGQLSNNAVVTQTAGVEAPALISQGLKLAVFAFQASPFAGQLAESQPAMQTAPQPQPKTAPSTSSLKAPIVAVEEDEIVITLDSETLASLSSALLGIGERE